MKKIAFIGTIADFKNYCKSKDINPLKFFHVDTDQDGSGIRHSLHGYEFCGFVISDYASGHSNIKAIVGLVLLRIKF